MKNRSFISLVVIVGVFAAVFWFLKKDLKPQESSQPAAAIQNEAGANAFRMVPFDNRTLIKPHSPIKGPVSAKVTLVEFLDPECEACAAMYPYVKKVNQEFAKDLRIVVRYMPFHRNSKYVANILEGTRAQNKYWEALELLFQTQSQWADHHNPNPDLIPEILKPLGLDMKKIIEDAKTGKYDAQILEDLEDGKSVGVNGTPTFFVIGVMLEQLGYESLKSAVETVLQNSN